MRFNEYPQAIADLRKKLAYLEVEVLQQQETVKFFDTNIESQVANDTTLKNETQRKVRKLELLQSDPNYFRESNLLRDLKLKAKLIEIDLMLVIDEFTIAKIEERKSIALMSQTADV